MSEDHENASAASIFSSTTYNGIPLASFTLIQTVHIFYLGVHNPGGWRVCCRAYNRWEVKGKVTGQHSGLQTRDQIVLEAIFREKEATSMWVDVSVRCITRDGPVSARTARLRGLFCYGVS